MSEEKSPILKCRSPLVLLKTYEPGLLPTPNMKPLRRVVWVRHPVIELENMLNIAKRDRVFTLLVDSEQCEYEMGIFLKYQTGIYGEKIARISSDGDESLKSQLQDEYSPRTKEIYNMLEGELLQAVHARAAAEEESRSDPVRKGRLPRRGKNPNSEFQKPSSSRTSASF